MNERKPTCAAALNCDKPELCPLNQVKAGTQVRIKQHCAPADVTLRLREMGFGEEQQVRLVSRHASVICQVCNARVALSSRLAETILVETLPPLTLAGAV